MAVNNQEPTPEEPTQPEQPAQEEEKATLLPGAELIELDPFGFVVSNDGSVKYDDIEEDDEDEPTD